LEDTMWQLVALTRGVNANQIQDGAFLNFQSVNSRIKGSTGCNRLMGGYKAQGEFIKLTEIASTKIFCPSGGIVQEALFIEALNDTRGWRIENKHLFLLDEKGDKVAVFEER
jgi:heat shock protein HslJ